MLNCLFVAWEKKEMKKLRMRNFCNFLIFFCANKSPKNTHEFLGKNGRNTTFGFCDDRSKVWSSHVEGLKVYWLKFEYFFENHTNSEIFDICKVFSEISRHLNGFQAPHKSLEISIKTKQKSANSKTFQMF